MLPAGTPENDVVPSAGYRTRESEEDERVFDLVSPARGFIGLGPDRVVGPLIATVLLEAVRNLADVLEVVRPRAEQLAGRLNRG